MELQHRFTVPASADVAWQTLNDVERVGSCFPGAAVTLVEGDDFAGTCKIKLGPISMQYAGTGRFVERDSDGHRAVIEAKGKDKRGNGTATVTVTAWLTPQGEQTQVSVDTDLTITGKPAQFGRGVIQDVSDKLLGQFAACLESTISAPASGPSAEPAAAAEPEPAPAPAPEPPATSAATAASAPAPADIGDPVETATPPTPPPPPPPRPQPAPAALDLGATVLPVLARRYGPQAVGLLALLLVLWRVLRR